MQHLVSCVAVSFIFFLKQKFVLMTLFTTVTNANTHTNTVQHVAYQVHRLYFMSFISYDEAARTQYNIHTHLHTKQTKKTIKFTKNEN